MCQRKRSSVQGIAGVVVLLSAEPKPRTSSISCSSVANKRPGCMFANATFSPMHPEPVKEAVGQAPPNGSSGVLNPRALPLGDFTPIFALPFIGLVEPHGVILAIAVASSALVALAT